MPVWAWDSLTPAWTWCSWTESRRTTRATSNSLSGWCVPGGLIAVDNALLSGGVASGEPIGHWSQEAIDRMRSINARLVSGEGLTGMVIPTGDGLAISVRS